MSAKANRKLSPRLRFFLGMVVYALIFIALMAVGFRFFWTYMEAYEASRPKTMMESYVRAFDDAKLRSHVEEYVVANTDRSLQNVTSGVELICADISTDISYFKKSSESTNERMLYVIRSGLRDIGTVVIEQAGEPYLGFKQWQVVEEEYDFPGYFSSSELVIPMDYTLSVGENQIGEEYIVETGIQYELLDWLYEKNESMPTMVRYKFDEYVGELDLTVKDSLGNDYVIPDELDEARFVNNCTEEELTKVNEFLDKFVFYYVTFTSSANDNIAGNLSNLKKYMVEDSELAKRMAGGVDGLIWASSRGDTLKNIAVHDCMNVGGGNFVCDITFTVDTVGWNGHVETNNNAKLLITTTNSGLKAAAMKNY